MLQRIKSIDPFDMKFVLLRVTRWCQNAISTLHIEFMTTKSYYYTKLYSNYYECHEEIAFHIVLISGSDGLQNPKTKSVIQISHFSFVIAINL